MSTFLTLYKLMEYVVHFFNISWLWQKCMAQMLLLAGPGVLISTVLIGAAVKVYKETVFSGSGFVLAQTFICFYSLFFHLTGTGRHHYCWGQFLVLLILWLLSLCLRISVLVKSWARSLKENLWWTTGINNCFSM